MIRRLMMRISIIVASLVLVSCAGAPVSQEQAIANALAEDATVRNLADTCTHVGGQARLAAYSAQKAWWASNAEIVKAADRGFINGVNASFGEREEAAVIGTLHFTQDVETSATSTVQKLLNGGNAEDKCVAALAPYESGEKDLSNDKKYRAAYTQLLEQSDADLSSLASARLANAKQRKYGRSLFVVENKVAGMGCQQPSITLLRNQWPLEVYDAQCADKSYLIARCEWGKCEIF